LFWLRRVILDALHDARGAENVPALAHGIARAYKRSTMAFSIKPPPVATCARTAAGIRDQCRTRGLSHDTRMESLGVMFGSEAAVRAHCEAAVDASAHMFECLTHPAMPTQTASLLLRYCALPRLGYLARTTHPDVLLEPARRFDRMALQAQMTILHQTDESLTALEPRTSDPDSTVHDPGDGDPPPGSQPTVTTDRVTAVTKQQLLQRMALPLSLGGLGLRTVESVRHPSYFASLHTILPYFARLHPELAVRPPSTDVAGAATSGAAASDNPTVTFQRTQLYRELVECQGHLIDAGAATRFGAKLTQSRRPHAAAATTAVPTTTNVAATAATVLDPTTAVPAAGTTPAPISILTPHTTPTAATAAPLPARFPSPPLALTQSIDATWRLATAVAARSSTTSTPLPMPTARKLQHALTGVIEAAAWVRLFNASGRYQQATMTSLALNSSISTWLTTPPLATEPAYRMRDADYRLAVRHRLGQLPYDDVRHVACVACASRNREVPTLLDDPDHAQSCTLQEGVTVSRRHDAVKLLLAQRTERSHTSKIGLCRIKVDQDVSSGHR
jgi:hypothetical protein